MENKVSGEKINKQSNGDGKQRKVWDCGSSLYDSFELKSFSRQLDSAIISSSSRTMSMPHLSSRPGAAPLPQPPPPRYASKKSAPNKFSKSFVKLVRSIFSSKHQSSSSSNNFYVLDKSDDDHVLSSIPEVLELDDCDEEVQTEFGSVAGRSRSERFAASSIGISCA